MILLRALSGSATLLRTNRTFRLLWLARIGSQFGDWFNLVALTQITLLLTRSPLALGLVLVCRSVPGVIFGPLVGPMVDRLPKKRVMAYTDSVRAICALGYSLAFLYHASEFLYVNSLVIGVAGILFDPTRNAALPLVVSHGDLAEANALDSGMNGVVQIVGAAGGGILAVTVNPIACFAINAASYVWSAMCIVRAQWQDSAAQRDTDSLYMAAFVAGFHVARSNRVVRAIILIGISWGLAGGGYYILIPTLGQQTFHLSGAGIGLLYTIDGIGVIIGSLLVRRFVTGRDRRAVIWYGIAYLLQALFFALLAQCTAVILGSLMLLFMRISSGIIIPLDTYLLQVYTAPAMRGRIFALHGSTYGGVMQLSLISMGYAYTRLGVPITGVLIGVMSFLCGASWLLQFGRQADKPV